MSRTVRRSKNLNYLEERFYTYNIDRPMFSPIGWAGFKPMPLPKPEYGKGYWQYHGDNYHISSWRGYRSDWGSVRCKNRTNLSNHLKDPEKDCFFWEDFNTKEWD